MNSKFYYLRYPGSNRLRASIQTNTNANKAVKLVVLYLIDDAGGGMDSYCESLKTCFTKLEDKSIYEDDISSEHYDVEIVGDRVKFEFEYDEDDCCEVDRAKLAQILSLWIAFLEKEPVEGYEEYHEITL